MAFIQIHRMKSFYGCEPCASPVSLKCSHSVYLFEKKVVTEDNF